MLSKQTQVAPTRQHKTNAIKINAETNTGGHIQLIHTTTYK